MSDVISHLEQHLGPIQEGWKPSAGDSRIHAVHFADRPNPGVDTFTTLGLSRTPLPMSNGRAVRQEFLISVYPRYPQRDIASFLTTFAEYVLSMNRALLRGDVIGPFKPLIPGVQAAAVYSSMPVFFEREFATYSGSTPPTVIVWLVPLVGPEPEFIRTAGWERFEEELERSENVDFWSLDRAPVV